MWTVDALIDLPFEDLGIVRSNAPSVGTSIAPSGARALLAAIAGAALNSDAMALFLPQRDEVEVCGASVLETNAVVVAL